MLQGFSGHLLSEAFLERAAADAAINAACERERRRLAEWRRRTWQLGPSSSVRAMLSVGAAPFAAALGFTCTEVVTRDRTAAATIATDAGRSMALLVALWGHPLDPLWREAVREALDRSTSWCILYNGSHLRFVDAGRLFTRRHAQFDLEQTLDDERTFAAFWTVLRTPELRTLVVASDAHAAAVRTDLQAGVLSASGDLLAALIGRRPSPRLQLDDAFEQALTIVYRIVFLLFAEARTLVPMWHPIYRESYSLESLRKAAEEPHGQTGLWDALRAIARLAHAGCRAGDLRVTPFNGRLFAPVRTPLAERRDLDVGAARRAVLALSTRPAADRAGQEPISYRDLGVEQIGAVYETLLDYRPAIERGASLRGAPHVRLRSGSGARKSTGTFYTQQGLVEYVVRRTLGPLVRDAAPTDILKLRVLDPAMGSGAFLVAACRYLAAAYEAALVRTGACHASDLSDYDRSRIRRTVAERCLYGVDLNPTAVQLARLSLWLTTLAGDRPLSFLDHRLRTGNSLLGAWMSLLGCRPQPPVRRRGVAPAARLFDQLDGAAAVREFLPIRFSLETVPNDTIDQVREKERNFAVMDSPTSTWRRWRRVGDLWCASWLDAELVPPEAFGALSDHILSDTGALPARIADEYLRHVDELSQAERPFHWELEYPEVFFSPRGERRSDGGFDAVLGNPPWVMLRADQHKDDDARRRSRRLLKYVNESSAYEVGTSGHVNCCQLFTERSVALTRAGGRVGLVLPAGIAMDHGSRTLRRWLLSRCDVDAVVGLDNTAGVFPIHRSIRFLLLTAAVGRPTGTIACRFGVTDPSELESVNEETAARNPWFPVRIQPVLLDRLSGDHLSIPWLRNPMDLAIAERAATLFPPLGTTSGWQAKFGRELNATDDRSAFREHGGGLSIVEGKQLEPFAVDVEASRWTISPDVARRRLGARWFARPRLAYRDVASATNRQTLIAAILPASCVSTHTIFCLRTGLPPRDQQFLCGLFNSFVVNFLVRLRVSTHVTTAIVEQLPIPTRRDTPAAVRELSILARFLSRRREPQLLARLHARVASLYQLTKEEFEYVLSTFPLVPAVERRDALEHFCREPAATTKARRDER